ncbi:MAG TPA: hypothetical protein VIA06_11160 [Candidatus Dormibacteraeota bacterium]|nr:hypothetical protein [Candidatus Dormibacteraeota bacterium]
MSMGWIDHWFESFNGLVGKPATGLVFSYVGSDDSQRAWIETELRSSPSAEPRSVGLAVLGMLINGLAPGDAQSNIAACVDDLKTMKPEEINWSSVAWTFKESALAGRIFRYCGCWAGFAVIDSSRLVLVASTDAISPDEVELIELKSEVPEWSFESSHSIQDLRMYRSQKPALKPFLMPSK